MKDMAMYEGRKMTVKEVADAIGTAESTIRNKVKELFPEIVENGKATLITEPQAVAIKKAILPRDLTLKSKLDSATTDLEMMEQAADVMSWLYRKVEAERSARIEAERRNAVLMHVAKTYTATEIAKELGMRSAQELNKFLADHKVQYMHNDTWVPYADYASLGYFDIKQEILDNGKVVYHRRITQDGRAFILSLQTDKNGK
jgi:predicted transcriptional regulator